MSRWKQAKQCIIDVGLVGRGANLNTTTLIVANHNADCDAYEARIAEMEEERDAAVEFAHATERAFCTANTELARVKAESLRVVVDGEAMSVDRLPVGLRVSISDRTGVYRRVGSGASAIPEPHSFVIMEDCNSGKEINVPYGTQAQPVRLERWEEQG